MGGSFSATPDDLIAARRQGYEREAAKQWNTRDHTVVHEQRAVDAAVAGIEGNLKYYVSGWVNDWGDGEDEWYDACVLSFPDRWPFGTGGQ